MSEKEGGVTNSTPDVNLQDLQIGSVPIGFPVVQAALSGYSDAAMRLVARRHGASYSICEVMLDQFLVAVRKRQRTKHYLHLYEEERPVGGQLMGAEPEQFSAGAAKLVEAGFDVIDINFGCPVKKVLGRCRGGYHLGQPREALEIIQRTRDAVPDPIPVTVKMRRGIDDSEESRENFFAILDGAFQIGVAAVTVHGRTVEQRYVGPSRWSFLAEVKQHIGDNVVLGSGDLFSAQDCLDMIRETGVDGVTVARGAIGNPWIFQQARALATTGELPAPPTLWEQKETIWEHFSLAAELYSGERAATVMRKFGAKFAALHPDHLNVRNAFVRSKTPDEWRDVLDTFYAEDLPGCYPPRSIHLQGNCS